MGQMVRKFVTQDSFDATSSLIRAGHIGTFDEDKLTGKEKHLKDIDGDIQPARVQVAPIGPTGPNPRRPQQVPPDAVQGANGEYLLPGAKVLVGEVTQPVDQRIDAAGLNTSQEAENTEALRGIMDTNNNDDALVAGTVAEVTANLGAQTDEQLTAMRAAEVDREKPRKGVLDAIDAELEGRKANS